MLEFACLQNVSMVSHNQQVVSRKTIEIEPNSIHFKLNSTIIAKTSVDRYLAECELFKSYIKIWTRLQDLVTFDLIILVYYNAQRNTVRIRKCACKYTYTVSARDFHP